MDIQFAFVNPKRRRGKRKKHVARGKKRSKLKNVRMNPKKRGQKMKRSHKRRRKNPKLITMVKKREGKKPLRHTETYPTKKELSKYRASYLKAATAEAKAAYGEGDMAKTSKAARKAREKLATQADKRVTALKTALAHRKEGYKISIKDIKGVTMAKKKGKGKKKGKRKSAKRAARKAAKRATRRRVPKRARKAARRGKKRAKRAYPRMITHRHARTVRHLPKGATLTGSIHGKGKRKKLRAKVKIRFNPDGLLGGKMPQVKQWTGHEVEDLTALVLGGATYGAINGLIARFAPKQLSDMVLKIPVVGAATLPLLAGALLHRYGGQVPTLGKWIQLLGEGLVGAAVVGAGVSASQMIPGLASPMSGVSYYPMSGVNYYPMSGVDYTPNLRGHPQLGARADFGRDADYGGSGGYTEGRPYSPADFGHDNEDENEEYIGLGGVAESQMG